MLVKAGMEFSTSFPTIIPQFTCPASSWSHSAPKRKSKQTTPFFQPPPPHTNKAPSQINGFVVSIHCLSVQSNLPYRWKINTDNSKVIKLSRACDSIILVCNSFVNLNWSRPARTPLDLYFMARRHPGTLIVQNPVLAYWFALSSALVTGRIHFRLRPQFRIFPHVSETCYHVSLSIQI